VEDELLETRQAPYQPTIFVTIQYDVLAIAAGDDLGLLLRQIEYLAELALRVSDTPFR